MKTSSVSRDLHGRNLARPGATACSRGPFFRADRSSASRRHSHDLSAEPIEPRDRVFPLSSLTGGFAGLALACLPLLFSGLLRGQNVVPAPGAAGETVVLSPFEVTSEKDVGYATSTAMTGTRTSEKLADLPNSISVMTQEFLQDIAVNNFLDAVEFATNAENLYNDSGTRGAALGTRSGNQISFRGLASIRQLRDGFVPIAMGSQESSDYIAVRTEYYKQLLKELERD